VDQHRPDAYSDPDLNFHVDAVPDPENQKKILLTFTAVPVHMGLNFSLML
jgi:hypothetical protein